MSSVVFKDKPFINSSKESLEFSFELFVSIGNDSELFNDLSFLLTKFFF